MLRANPAIPTRRQSVHLMVCIKRHGEPEAKADRHAIGSPNDGGHTAQDDAGKHVHSRRCAAGSTHGRRIYVARPAAVRSNRVFDHQSGHIDAQLLDGIAEPIILAAGIGLPPAFNDIGNASGDVAHLVKAAF